MKYIRIISFLVSLSFIFNISAQQVLNTEDPRKPSFNLPIEPSLYELATSYYQDREEAEGIIDVNKVIIREGELNLRVYHPKYYQGVPTGLINKYDLEVYKVGMKYSSVYILPENIISFAGELPEGYYITQDHAADAYDEGPDPTVHNSIDYISSGPGGSGIKIAVIDVGFNGLPAAISNGRAPATYDSLDFSGSGLLNGSSHGTAVTETVFDHAPNATYYLYKVTTSSQCENAVDDAHNNESVDIINMSLGYRTQGWEDDSSSLCTAVNAAANDGILVFVSAGNSKRMHWQGTFSDNDNDGWHEWTGADELNGITLQDTTTLRISLIWDISQGTDYDVFVYNSTGNQVLASNVMAGTAFETVNYLSNPGFAVPVAIAVRKVSGPDVDFEILCRTDGNGASVVNDQLERIVTASSITWPASCSAPNVIGVAGVIDDDFNSPPGTTGIDEVYSSEGPTNDGNPGVDITGATRTTIGASGSFFGTSAASPNAAGAAAALWATQTALDADNLRYLLYKKADIFLDWGDPGYDFVYGNGGLRLYDYMGNTRYVDVSVSNPGGLSSRVYQYVSHAHSALPSPPDEGAIIIFGGNYPNPYTPYNFTTFKKFIMKNLGSDATLGEN